MYQFSGEPSPHHTCASVIHKLQNMVKSCLCLDGNAIWNWMLYIHLKYIFLAFPLFTSQAFFLCCSTPSPPPPPRILTPHPTPTPMVRNFISIWEQYSIAVHYKASSSKRLGWAVRRIAGRLSMSQSDSRVFVVSLRAVSQFPYIDPFNDSQVQLLALQPKRCFY